VESLTRSVGLLQTSWEVCFRKIFLLNRRMPAEDMEKKTLSDVSTRSALFESLCGAISAAMPFARDAT